MNPQPGLSVVTSSGLVLASGEPGTPASWLDREVRPMIRLHVLILEVGSVDRSVRSHIGVGQVRVHLTDLNDNAPIFLVPFRGLAVGYQTVLCLDDAITSLSSGPLSGVLPSNLLDKNNIESSLTISRAESNGKQLGIDCTQAASFKVSR
ncbi:unnamed protein product [Protopolystoma xenopodis]|uniref:Cadherin domain-containing protein n=1 Tax=Protopolystoma xenopodis TaxID=117903 RepID=A0A448WT60_9PLAT|nr:unnamed protein product [Protopolystoma xenopodis]